jgi:hypothetical protein
MNKDILTEWIEIRVPQHCDICGEHSRKLRLIGGAKKREWLCPTCITEAEHLLLNSDEFLKIRLDQKKAKEVAKSTEDADLEKRKKTGII